MEKVYRVGSFSNSRQQRKLESVREQIDRCDQQDQQWADGYGKQRIEVGVDVPVFANNHYYQYTDE